MSGELSVNAVELAISVDAEREEGARSGAKVESEEREKKGRVPYDIYDYPVQQEGPGSGFKPIVPPCYKRRVGRFFVCIEGKRKDGSPKLICMVGPAWPMIFVTLSLIIGISTLVFAFCLPTIPVYMTPIGIILQVGTVVCYLFTACSDPGIEPLTLEKPEPESDLWVYDEQIGSYFDKSKRTVFSREALVVARDVDHFCPWTGTLIAGGNMCCFQFFTGLLCILCGYTLFVLLSATILRQTFFP